MRRSYLPHVVLAISAVLAVAAVVMLVLRLEAVRREQAVPADAPAGEAAAGASGREEKPVVPAPVPEIGRPMPPETPEETLGNVGTVKPAAEAGKAAGDPAVVVGDIAKAINEGNFDEVARLAGRAACDDATLARLKALAADHPLKIRQPGGIREVGELELNALTRWALELEGAEPGRDRLFLDLRQRDGKWSVERLTLPPAAGGEVPRAVLADPLGIADAFMQAVLRQDFEFACAFVDGATVSDAKIAALCILFEEGQYEMRASKPLRAMFERGDTVGYLGTAVTTGGGQAAQFSLTLRQPPGPENWIITEINLDELLADHARRFADGDVYYSPLVRNPQGGDTLALYFEFDEDAIRDRTRRQLEIVCQILKADPGKKITLSGHTDSLGTEEYNNSLSARRAGAVRDFLISSGVDARQIVTVAKGASQPRRPNVTETGEDDPRGRRVNRRTEIYLDF